MSPPARVEPQPTVARPAEPRWQVMVCFLLLVAAIQLVLGPKIQLSQWSADAANNAGLAEGEAWLHGRLDIPHPGRDASTDRMHDTAYVNGKVYNVFPPLMGFLHVALSPIHRLLFERTAFWPPWSLLAIVFWPLPIVAYCVFRRHTTHPGWAILLTLVLMGGTAVLPNLRYARGGQLAQCNHVMSQVALLLIAGDVLGRRRVWPALIGLAIGAWTRQMTVLYALPILWMAWRERRLPLCLVGLAAIAAPLLTLNQLKFGNPLDFGYRQIYVGRDMDDPMTERCTRWGVFSPHFIPDNLYYMHIAPPDIRLGLTGPEFRDANNYGTSIWLTTPLLLFAPLTIRRWWGDPGRRALMLGTIPVMLGLACYHSPGFLQQGYNRFALDFIPIWLVVFAPWVGRGRRAWVTLGCAAWSLLYFQTIVPG